MRLRVFLAGLVLFAAIASPGPLFACGDKYLNLGLGTSYDSSPAERRAAAILIYANAGSELQRSLTTLALDAGLRKQDYRPTIVLSAAEFDAALQRKWDIVIVDGRDSAAVSQRVQKAGAPHVVPVLTRPTRDELSAAKKTYHTVVNTPTKSGAFVDPIEDALYLHAVEAETLARAAKKATR